MVTTLNLKLFRELTKLRGQILSIALVVAAGIMAAVSMRSTFVSLTQARDAYFRDYRFADVFASLQRAPDAALREIADIPGVLVAEARVKQMVNLRVAGLDQPARGQLVSLPDATAPLLNQLHITAGRSPAPGSTDEVLVSGRFAENNHLTPGDTLEAVINGRLQVLRVVGSALSPEYVYEIDPSGIFLSDERLFGVLWMPRAALAAATGMTGAFNDVTLALAPGANESAVIRTLDDALRRYGGLGAFGRADQVSSRVINDEIQQNRATANILPIVFLLVAAFLLHIVLHRLIATQRVNIATLKAFGYGDGRIGMHYLAFAVVPVAGGVGLGLVLGQWLGSAYTGLYAEIFRFPNLTFVISWPTFFAAAAVSAAAALLGAAGAVRTAIRLQAAEGMNPAPPARYRRLLLERLNLHRALTPVQRMIARNLERRPLRALAAATGVGAGLAVMLVGLNLLDSITVMVDRQFGELQRENLDVVYQTEQPWRATPELRRLNGVTHAEPFRMIPVRLTHGHRDRRLAITGLSPDAVLRRMVDRAGSNHTLPAGALLITDRLANVLDVSVGDTVMITRLDQDEVEEEAVVGGTIDEIAGVNAYMSIGDLHDLFGELPRVNGAHLAIERGSEQSVVRSLEEMPDVAGVISKSAVIRAFDEQLGESLRITFTILFILAAVLASGVIYNSARIALSERSHEFATLRVLGFSGTEVSTMLLGEEGVVTFLGLPIGVGLGAGVSIIVIRAFDTEQYRVPFVMNASSTLIASVLVAGIAAASGWLVRRKLLRVDLIAALKVRE